MLTARNKKGRWKHGDMLVLPIFGEVWIVLNNEHFLEINVNKSTVTKFHWSALPETERYIGNIKEVCDTLGVDCIDLSCYNIKEDK